MNLTALFQLSYGVYVVSAMDGDRYNGCIANSVMQVTAEPPALAVSINKDSFTYDCIRESGRFSISILKEDSNPRLIGTFGFQKGRFHNKFDGVRYEEKDGLPILSEACAYALCNVRETLDAGTHMIFLADIVDCDHISEGTPMTYAYYHRVIKGKSPKEAPTYQPKQ